MSSQIEGSLAISGTTKLAAVQEASGEELTFKGALPVLSPPSQYTASTIEPLASNITIRSPGPLSQTAASRLEQPQVAKSK